MVKSYWIPMLSHDIMICLLSRKPTVVLKTYQFAIISHESMPLKFPYVAIPCYSLNCHHHTPTVDQPSFFIVKSKKSPTIVDASILRFHRFISMWTSACSPTSRPSGCRCRPPSACRLALFRCSQAPPPDDSGFSAANGWISPSLDWFNGKSQRETVVFTCFYRWNMGFSCKSI